MAEYIERDKLGIGRCNPEVFEDKGYAKGWNAAIEIIQSAPSADVRPVVRGRWIYEPGHIPRCSVCGRYSDDADTGEAICCPFCGAKMEEET